MITKITFEDYKELEEIGKGSLPIYYNIQEIFLLDTVENKIMLKYVVNIKLLVSYSVVKKKIIFILILLQ